MTQDSTDRTTDQTKARARLFWEQSGTDLNSARKSLRRGQWPEAGLVSLQAAVNALSCVCILHGHFQLPSSSPVGLLSLCLEIDNVFEELQPACVELEQAAELNPFAPAALEPGIETVARKSFDRAALVRKGIGQYLKFHRNLYFSP